MPAAILNVSLDDKLGSGLSVDRRHRMVMACMRLMFPGACIGEIGTAAYDGPHGPVQERRSIVQVELEGVSRAVFEDGIHHIAQSMGQDCIAVLYDDGTGTCVGPLAQLWPFQRKFFILPAVCRLGKEAA